NHVPAQSVTGPARRDGVMFNPCSSRSRLRIVDSGRRYGVRLRPEGVVEYSIDGDKTWLPLDPLKDPCSDRQLPRFVSNDELRTGTELTNVTFDMIAVGRGRIIGKETGTDRIFHVYMDELFRTFEVKCDPSDPKGKVLTDDQPVPPFN